MVDVHRKELDKMAAELSGSKPGSPAYIACYGKAFKTIEEGLDEETWVKYRSEAKQWSELVFRQLHELSRAGAESQLAGPVSSARQSGASSLGEPSQF